MNRLAHAEHADFAALRARLRLIDMERLDSAGYRAINRELRTIKQGPPLRVAYLGNMTLDLLPPYVNANCARVGWLAATHMGHFGQYFQQLHTPEFQGFEADIVLLVLSLRLLRPDAIANISSLDERQRRALVEDVLKEVDAWIAQATATSKATLLIANFPIPSSPALGIADAKQPYGEIECHLELNLALQRKLRDHPRAQLLDVARIAAQLGHAQAFDERMFHISKSNWSDAMMAAVGREVARHVVAARGTAAKCLALDIDNTLWGGIVGEDGPLGVKIGHGDAESEAFLAFQQRIRTLKDRGILLALCSKNNPADVEEAFRSRPEMALRVEDFSAHAISWDPKHQGLVDIAAALNIGVDAIVFIDDNPAEIQLVREKLPMVECVLLPADPSAFVATLDALPYFEKSIILTEDTAKAQQYAEETQRNAFSQAYDSMDDYLAGLQMEVEIAPVNSGHLPRIHQLFNKTNQFNVTTRRYSMGELEAMLDSPVHHLGMVSLRDRFGDLGIIGTFILKEVGPVLHIDSLLMSCRALGRGVETAIMNQIKTHLLASEHLAVLTAEFIPTERNKPAESYFAAQGFHLDETAAGENEAYVLYKAEVETLECDWLTIKGAQQWNCNISTLNEYS
jgi:FkbH-like protein